MQVLSLPLYGLMGGGRQVGMPLHSMPGRR